MTARQRAAIYARISQDRGGEGLGVQRQLADCRAEAIRLGWTVAEEYVDDDTSAYSGKPRPAYQRLLTDVAAGRRDGILAWHIDRLHRRPIELENLAQTCARAGLTDLRTVTGSFDLGTGDGLLVARLLAAVAANESDSKRRRGRRKMLEIAEAGRPHGGGYRPFGFLPDRVTHDQAEAAEIQRLAARALAGESLTALCRDLTARGVGTATGATWRTPVLRQLLLSPRNYGVRVHQGKPFGAGTWQPIISPEDGEALRRLLTDPSRRTNRSARTYLLSGLCHCGLCGTKMVSAPRKLRDGTQIRRYLCRSGHDFGGCGSMTITAEPLEQIVSEAVIIRLTSPAMSDALAGRRPDPSRLTELREQIDADDAQLAELAGMYADRAITGPEWVTARASIEQRRERARTEVATIAGDDAATAFAVERDTLRARWPAMSLDQRRAVVTAITDHVVIHPGKQGTHTVDTSRVEPIWRV